MTSANRVAARKIFEDDWRRERDTICKRIIELRLLKIRFAAGERTTWSDSQQIDIQSKYKNGYGMVKHSLRHYKVLRRRYWEAKR